MTSVSAAMFVACAPDLSSMTGAMPWPALTPAPPIGLHPATPRPSPRPTTAKRSAESGWHDASRRRSVALRPRENGTAGLCIAFGPFPLANCAGLRSLIQTIRRPSTVGRGAWQALVVDRAVTRTLISASGDLRLRRRKQTFALGALAGHLAGAADGFRVLARRA